VCKGKWRTTGTESRGNCRQVERKCRNREMKTRENRSPTVVVMGAQKVKDTVMSKSPVKGREERKPGVTTSSGAAVLSECFSMPAA